MITIDYNVRDQVPPILESDVDNKVVICHTDFMSHQVIYYAVRKCDILRGDGVSFRGVWTDYPAQHPVIYTTAWNWAPKLINLMINKITEQSRYKHTFYVIENEMELQELVNKLRIVNILFLEEVSARFRGHDL